MEIRRTREKHPAALLTCSPLSVVARREDAAAILNKVESPLTLKRRLLSKQLSMKETTREKKWETKRRKQIMKRQRTLMSKERCATIAEEEKVGSVTDDDLDELRGSIDLGFGFIEEEGGQDLCNTLPALDLYFAVNRQLSDPKMRFSQSPQSTPRATSSSSAFCRTRPPTPSPRRTSERQQSLPHSFSAEWKMVSPGDNPQHVKTRLRLWAQVVACSVKQCK